MHKSGFGVKNVAKIKYLLFLVLLFEGYPLIAQPADSLSDSTKLYSNIENYSERSKFTKFLYRLVFKPVAPASNENKPTIKPAQKPYSAFEGKVIRNIHIETLTRLVIQSAIQSWHHQV